MLMIYHAKYAYISSIYICIFAFGDGGEGLNPSLINIDCAYDIFSPRHNQTLHFSSERAALWHPGTSLFTSSSLCVSKNIARIAITALHDLPGKSCYI